MKFKVVRSSDFGMGSCVAPCEEAVYTGKDEWGVPTYEVEVNTLEELMALVEKYGSFIVSRNELEIYDSYRE